MLIKIENVEKTGQRLMVFNLRFKKNYFEEKKMSLYIDAKIIFNRYFPTASMITLHGKINDKNHTSLIPLGNRELFCDKKNKPFELINLNNGNTEYAICIGLNPKYINPKAMDDSNVRLVNYCEENKLGGYLLINLYSIRTNNVKDFNQLITSKSLKPVDDMSDVIIDLLKAHTTERIILFYGDLKIKYVCSKLKSFFNTISTSRFYYSSNEFGVFRHISANDYYDIFPKGTTLLW